MDNYDYEDEDGYYSLGIMMMGGKQLNLDSPEAKLSWLRSHIIGLNADFVTPYGRRPLTYADHNASGQALHYIESFITRKVLPFYGNTHTRDSYVGRRTTKTVDRATQYIKKCLGGGRNDAIIFCGSGSTSAIKRLQEVVGIAVPSIMRSRILECLSHQERWVVFVGPNEHHSNLLSWRQSLAEVIEIGLDADGLIDIEALRRQLHLYKDSNRPILGSFSACSNVTGIYSDTRAIARLLHQHGAFACFDLAASGPYVEINMKSGEIDGYDAIYLSPHKFVGGPGSPGILLMSKALYQLKSSPPSTCGGGTVSYVNGFNEKDTLYLNNIEDRESGGTPPIIQIIRAALAFWVKDFIGYQVIESKECIYIEKALKRLLPNKNILVLGNTSAKRQATLSFLVYSTHNASLTTKNTEEDPYIKGKPLHGAFVVTLLSDLFGIQARGGCACAGPYGHTLLGIDESDSLKIRSAIEKGYLGVKPGWTRISLTYYMSNQEFEFILAAIEFIAIYGQRFLSLYHFNLKTGNWKFKTKTYRDLKGKESNHHREDPLDKQCNSPSGQQPKTNYNIYLQTAKQIANLLPRFPPQSRLPEDIDHDNIHFRV